jgi:hypothetical protein
MEQKVREPYLKNHPKDCGLPVIWTALGVYHLFNYSNVWLEELKGRAGFEEEIQRLHKFKENLGFSGVYDKDYLCKKIPSFLKHYFDLINTEEYNVLEKQWEGFLVEKKEESLNSILEKLAIDIGYDNKPNLEFVDDDAENYGNCSYDTICINHAILKDLRSYMSVVFHELYHFDQRYCTNVSPKQLFLFQVSKKSIEDVADGVGGQKNRLLPTEVSAHMVSDAVLSGNIPEIDKSFFCANIKFLKQVSYMNANPDEFMGYYAFNDNEFKLAPADWKTKAESVVCYSCVDKADCSNIEFILPVFKAKIKETSFRDSVFDSAVFVGGSFYSCDCRRAVFTGGAHSRGGAIIDSFSFIDCDFTECDLSEIDLILGDSCFKSCKISNTRSNREFVEKNVKYFKDIEWKDCDLPNKSVCDSQPSIV